MSKHTPGPWGFHVMTGESGRVTKCESFDAHTVDIGAGETLICSVVAIAHKVADYGGFPHTADFEENTANARLIAAAPDYHEATDWITQAVANNAAPVNPIAALEEMALNGQHITLDAGLVLDLLKAHAKAEGKE